MFREVVDKIGKRIDLKCAPHAYVTPENHLSLEDIFVQACHQIVYWKYILCKYNCDI